MKNKIAVVGGDKRQLFVADALAKRGCDLCIYGDFENEGSGVTACESVEDALTDSRAVILPMPLTRDSVYVNFGSGSEKKIKISEIFEMANGKLVLAGNVPPIVKDFAQKEKIQLEDYYDSENVRVDNAYLTAEGAIFGAMSMLDISIADAKVALTGFGRIGNALARLLVSLGADVTVAARKERDLVLAKSLGCNTLRICVDMEKKSSLLPLAKSYDVIFNTVPAWIFDSRFFAALSKNTVMIELASAPGGFDASLAEKSGAHVVSLQGIPGKYAPVSAGKILLESIEKILEKEMIL